MVGKHASPQLFYTEFSLNASVFLVHCITFDKVQLFLGQDLGCMNSLEAFRQSAI